MAIRRYLAMTAAEIQENSNISIPPAWMACHFSSYGQGLSNLPQTLPPGALLMVDDSTPIRGHDRDLITQQLAQCAEALDCCGVILDFQRPDCEETAALAHCLIQALPCPVAVSDLYARDLTCPVFLSPASPSMSLADHLASWTGREIWLDVSPAGEEIILTEKGAETTDLPHTDWDAPGFADPALHCHYHIQTNETQAIFTLWRTQEDLEDLIAEAENLGAAAALGLYQELTDFLIA